MVEQSYALYVEGRENPIGVLRDSTLSSVDELKKSSGIDYRVEPITSEEARNIRDRICPIF